MERLNSPADLIIESENYDKTMARRYKSLHHNLQEGQNVVFHREHRSPRNRSKTKQNPLKKYNKSDRRKWNQMQKNPNFINLIDEKMDKKQ